MSVTTQRTLQDRMAGVRRFMRALGNNPEEWEPYDLVALQHLEDEITIIRSKVVLGLRESGYSDVTMAEALGITRQAVSKRWPGGRRYVGAAGRFRTSQTNQEA
jgi:hypothetical protein